MNPGQFILAYTSKSLPAEQSDFYRLSDGTLFKDAGIQESFAKIEDSLRESLDVDRLWKAALHAIPNQQTRAKLEKALAKSIKNESGEPLKKAMTELGGKIKDSMVEKSIDKVLKLVFEAGTK